MQRVPAGKASTDTGQWFVELRRRVFECGDPFVPQEITCGGHLLGYVVFSGPSLRTAVHSYERQLTRQRRRAGFAEPDDESLSRVVALACPRFGEDVVRSLWGHSEADRRLREAATEPLTARDERIAEAERQRDLWNGSSLGLDVLAMLAAFQLPASVFDPDRRNLPDWAWGEGEPSVGGLFAGALHRGDAGLLKKLIAFLKNESKTSPKERDWIAAEELYGALLSELRAVYYHQAEPSAQLAKRLELLDSAATKTDVRLPSTQALEIVAAEFNVSTSTAEKAIKRVRRERKSAIQAKRTKNIPV